MSYILIVLEKFLKGRQNEVLTNIAVINVNPEESRNTCDGNDWLPIVNFEIHMLLF